MNSRPSARQRDALSRCLELMHRPSLTDRLLSLLSLPLHLPGSLLTSDSSPSCAVRYHVFNTLGASTLCEALCSDEDLSIGDTLLHHWRIALQMLPSFARDQCTVHRLLPCLHVTSWRLVRALHSTAHSSGGESESSLAESALVALDGSQILHALLSGALSEGSDALAEDLIDKFGSSQHLFEDVFMGLLLVAATLSASVSRGSGGKELSTSVSPPTAPFSLPVPHAAVLTATRDLCLDELGSSIRAMLLLLHAGLWGKDKRREGGSGGHDPREVHLSGAYDPGIFSVWTGPVLLKLTIGLLASIPKYTKAVSDSASGRAARDISEDTGDASSSIGRLQTFVLILLETIENLLSYRVMVTSSTSSASAPIATDTLWNVTLQSEGGAQQCHLLRAGVLHALAAASISSSDAESVEGAEKVKLMSLRVICAMCSLPTTLAKLPMSPPLQGGEGTAPLAKVSLLSPSATATTISGGVDSAVMIREDWILRRENFQKGADALVTHLFRDVGSSSSSGSSSGSDSTSSLRGPSFLIALVRIIGVDIRRTLDLFEEWLIRPIPTPTSFRDSSPPAANSSSTPPIPASMGEDAAPKGDDSSAGSGKRERYIGAPGGSAKSSSSSDATSDAFLPPYKDLPSSSTSSSSSSSAAMNSSKTVVTRARLLLAAKAGYDGAYRSLESATHLFSALMPIVLKHLLETPADASAPPMAGEMPSDTFFGITGQDPQQLLLLRNVCEEVAAAYQFLLATVGISEVGSFLKVDGKIHAPLTDALARLLHPTSISSPAAQSNLGMKTNSNSIISQLNVASSSPVSTSSTRVNDDGKVADSDTESISLRAAALVPIICLCAMGLGSFLSELGLAPSPGHGDGEDDDDEEEQKVGGGKVGERESRMSITAREDLLEISHFLCSPGLLRALLFQIATDESVGHSGGEMMGDLQSLAALAASTFSLVATSASGEEARAVKSPEGRSALSATDSSLFEAIFLGKRDVLRSLLVPQEDSIDATSTRFHLASPILFILPALKSACSADALERGDFSQRLFDNGVLQNLCALVQAYSRRARLILLQQRCAVEKTTSSAGGESPLSHLADPLISADMLQIMQEIHGILDSSMSANSDISSSELIRSASTAFRTIIKPLLKMGGPA